MSSKRKVSLGRTIARLLAGIASLAMVVGGSSGCDKADGGPLSCDCPDADDCPGPDNCLLCCTEQDFQVGGSITTGGAVGVAAQAVADFAAAAAVSIDELTAACRSIAEELDVSAEERQAAEQRAEKRDRMEAYCDLAVSAIGSLRAEAGGSLSVDLELPVCEASVRAKADCQARCAGGVPCDLDANPPTCEGGTLEVACWGGCTGVASAPVLCEGACLGSCAGSCTAQDGVDCAGRCDGTCSAGAAGSGIQADGICQGTCVGKCEVAAPNASCAGTCKGRCDGTCQGSPDSSVRCDGACAADYEPMKCIGGELTGGCTVSSKCEACCAASVTAKEECKPPKIEVQLSGAANAEAAGKLQLALEANLGIVAALRARSEAMTSVTPPFVASVDADTLAAMKVACIPVVISAVAVGAMDAEAALAASVSVVGAVH